MKFPSLTNSLLLVGTFLLAGCPTKPIVQPGPGQILSDACKAIPEPSIGGKIVIRGFEFPYKVNAPIKLGEMTFDAKDGQRVSDAIYAMSESRRNQCVYVAGVLLATPPANAGQIVQILQGFTATNNRSDRLLALLGTKGATVADAVAIADELKNDAKDAEAKTVDVLNKPAVVTTPPPVPASSSSGGSNTSAPLKVGFNDLEQVVADMIRSVVGLQKKLDGMRIGALRHHISVSGYESRGTSMTAEMKIHLAARFESVIASVPADTVPHVAIVGYADEEGMYLQNLEIGLQRAKIVANYLENHFPHKVEIKLITSGGVLRNDPFGRRVDLIFS